jgi:hypothetical protein
MAYVLLRLSDVAYTNIYSQKRYNMRKLSVLILTLGLFCLSQAAANQGANAAALIAAQYDTEVEIKVEELPQAVRDVLKADDFTGWEVSKCFHVKKDGKEYYKIVFKQGEEKETLYFLANGEFYEPDMK